MQSTSSASSIFEGGDYYPDYSIHLIGFEIDDLHKKIELLISNPLTEFKIIKYPDDLVVIECINIHKNDTSKINKLIKRYNEFPEVAS